MGEDLDSFCALEKLVTEEVSRNSLPNSDTDSNDDSEHLLIESEKMVRKLNKKLEQFEKEKQIIARERKQLNKEKMLFAKEKAEYESEQILNPSYLNDEEQNHKKYKKLKEKYEREREGWKEEKMKLLVEIEILKKSNNELKEQLGGLQKNTLDQNSLENDEFINETYNYPRKTSKYNKEDTFGTPKKSDVNEDINFIQEQSHISNNNGSPAPPIYINSSHSSLASPIPDIKPNSPKHFVLSGIDSDDDIPDITKGNTNATVFRVDLSKPDETEELAEKRARYFKNRPQKRKYNISSEYEIYFPPKPTVEIESKTRMDGRKIVKYKDGSSGTAFPNGTLKLKNNGNIYVYYSNGDIIQHFSDGTTAYKYAENGTVELSIIDGTKIYEFSSGQKEKHFANGDKAVEFPNGEFKLLFANGDFEVRSPNGKIKRSIGGKVTETYEMQ